MGLCVCVCVCVCLCVCVFVCVCVCVCVYVYVCVEDEKQRVVKEVFLAFSVLQYVSAYLIAKKVVKDQAQFLFKFKQIWFRLYRR